MEIPEPVIESGSRGVLMLPGAGAQTRCPGGVAPGSVLCQPDLPQSGSGSGKTIVKIVGHWDKTWGAIADSPNLIGGVSTGELSSRPPSSGRWKRARSVVGARVSCPLPTSTSALRTWTPMFAARPITFRLRCRSSAPANSV